jgi:branched-chain amino acid transport system permease protein
MTFFVQFYAQHSRLLDEIGINALLALSLSVSLQAGQLALAQAGFAGIAAYVSAIASMQYHWPLFASILLAVACSTLVAALLAYPVRRLRGIFLAIATVGFGEIVRVIVNNLSITGGAEGLSGIPNDVNTGIIYGSLAVVAIALFGLARTKFALAVALTREDEAAARGVGVDTGLVRFASLALGGAIAGLAGALYAHAFYFLAPADFGFPRMEEILVWCVIGAVETLAVAYGLSAWRDALTFGVMFLILVARPAGIFGARMLRNA